VTENHRSSLSWGIAPYNGVSSYLLHRVGS